MVQPHANLLLLCQIQIPQGNKLPLRIKVRILVGTQAAHARTVTPVGLEKRRRLSQIYNQVDQK